MPDIHLTYKQALAAQWALNTQSRYLKRLHVQMLESQEPDEDLASIADEIEQIEDVRAVLDEVL